WNKRIGADDCIFPNHRTIQHRRSHADEHPFFQRAPMDNRIVADRYFILQNERIASIQMADRIFLDAATIANPDFVFIATQDDIEPNARLRATLTSPITFAPSATK